LEGILNCIYFVFQSAFMNEQQQTLDTLKDIRSMMDRSSRFISLSGLSGVAAGACALVGAWFAKGVVDKGIANHSSLRKNYENANEEAAISLLDYTGSQLLWIAVATFTGALFLAFFFTWLRSRKTGARLWGPVTFRLTLAVGIPIFIGFLYLLKLMQVGAFGLIAPGCLLFYGLGLLNASRYTTDEIKYLGYAMLVVGCVNLLYPGFGLYFWAFGFGVLHILYGIIMWNKYERGKSQ
jgi:hypothetical protein